jgi:hypothetical protein
MVLERLCILGYPHQQLFNWYYNFTITSRVYGANKMNQTETQRVKIDFDPAKGDDLACLLVRRGRKVIGDVHGELAEALYEAIAQPSVAKDVVLPRWDKILKPEYLFIGEILEARIRMAELVAHSVLTYPAPKQEDVERVARAIAGHNGADPDATIYESLGASNANRATPLWESYLEHANAALAVMPSNDIFNQMLGALQVSESVAESAIFCTGAELKKLKRLASKARKSAIKAALKAQEAK